MNDDRGHGTDEVEMIEVEREELEVG